MSQIVASVRGENESVFLQFGGDRPLSIVRKALLLAVETKIKDAILADQIKP